MKKTKSSTMHKLRHFAYGRGNMVRNHGVKIPRDRQPGSRNTIETLSIKNWATSTNREHCKVRAHGVQSPRDRQIIALSIGLYTGLWVTSTNHSTRKEWFFPNLMLNKSKNISLCLNRTWNNNDFSPNYRQ